MKSAHHFHVKRLQRVAGWLDEVNTSVNAVVDNVHAVDLVLSVEVGIEALLNVFHNWAPRFRVVYKVTEARCVDDGESQTDTVLLNVGADGLNGDGARCEVKTRLLGFLWWVERCVEKGVDKRRLSETGFT